MKAVSGIISILLLTTVLTLAFNIQTAKSDWTWTETIYIRADGSIDPSTAPISTTDNMTYTLTENIVNVPIDSSAIIVERSNIIVEGASHTVQGYGKYAWGSGINLTYSNNVTIRNMQVTNFRIGIELHYSGNSTLSCNTASNNKYGIDLRNSGNSTLSGNIASNNTFIGIHLYDSGNSTLSGNIASNTTVGCGIIMHQSSNSTLSGNIASNNKYDGIHLHYSGDSILLGNVASNNNSSGNLLLQSNDSTLSGNTASNNQWGIVLLDSNNSVLSCNIASNNTIYGIYLLGSGNNTFFHNNLLNNTVQANVTAGYVNTWNNGYPSGGNYWSDYAGVDLHNGPHQNETGSDGIGDTHYLIDENNQDNYPLMEPWSPKPPSPVEPTRELIETIETWELPKGTENSLKAKLKTAIHLLDMGKEDGAVRKLTAFTNRVEMLREKTLTNEQADYLVAEAQRIIDLING
jgi:parallel beta-helix repeat protein